MLGQGPLNNPTFASNRAGYKPAESPIALAMRDKRSSPFHLRVFAGVTNSSVKITGVTTNVKTKPMFTIGLEGEFFLPTEKEKWSFLLSSAYNAYPTNTTQINNRIYTIAYKTIDVQLGFRYYAWLGESSRLYLNPSLVFYTPINSEINGKTPSNGFTYSVTAGYAYDNFSLEFRYYPERQIVSDVDENARYWSYSFLLGYRIF